jgi:hypothetical protein
MDLIFHYCRLILNISLSNTYSTVSQFAVCICALAFEYLVHFLKSYFRLRRRIFSSDSQWSYESWILATRQVSKDLCSYRTHTDTKGTRRKGLVHDACVSHTKTISLRVFVFETEWDRTPDSYGEIVMCRRFPRDSSPVLTQLSACSDFHKCIGPVIISVYLRNM